MHTRITVKRSSVSQNRSVSMSAGQKMPDSPSRNAFFTTGQRRVGPFASTRQYNQLPMNAYNESAYRASWSKDGSIGKSQQRVAGVMTPNAHERIEWQRMAADAAKCGREAFAKAYSKAALMESMPVSDFDTLQILYRAWLLDGWKSEVFL